MALQVAVDDPKAPDVDALLHSHFELMRSQSPIESCHVLPADALSEPDVTVFTVRDAGDLVAVGALKVDGSEAELKSMHTAQKARGRGAGAVLVSAILDHARAARVTRVNLETGSGPEHLAARRLYERCGFEMCPPFGDYTDDPLSAFMTIAL